MRRYYSVTRTGYMQTPTGLLKYQRMEKTFQFAGERGIGLRHLPVVIVLNPQPFQPYESHLLIRVPRKD